MNVTEARTRLGWTRTQLADKLGCSPESIKSWELGRRTPPGMLEPALKWVLYENGRNDNG